MTESVKTEFHIHTRFSKDSLLTGPFLLLMCKFRKIKCIAITDHNELKGALSYRNSFEKKGIRVIPGEEIFSKDGEIIGLFLKERIEPGMSAEKTAKEIKKQGGMVYIPHPYDEKRYKTVIKEDALQRIIGDVDIIEVHNGRNVSPAFSEKQKEIQSMYGKTACVGSDAHTFFEIGRNYAKLSSVEKDELLKALETAEFTERKCLFLSHKWTIVAKLLKRFGRG